MAVSLASDRDRETLKSFARRIDPSDAGAHNNLGVLSYNKGLHEEAVAAFTQAPERDDAIRFWERSLALDPDNPIVRQNIDAAKELP